MARRCFWALTALIVATGPAFAEIAVTANDNHSIQVDGTLTAARNPAPDNVSVIDLARYPPRVVATIDAPASVVGAPNSIWLAPDETWLIVTAATRIDPKNPDKIVPDDRVSVIDLKAHPPKLVQQVTAGAGANEISVSPDGRLALVANRAAGTLSVFTVNDKRLTAAGTVDFGNTKSLPSSVMFLPDGKTALVTRYGDNMTSVLHIDGTKVTIDPRPLTTALAPCTLDVAADGRLAAVSNMGRGNGDEDTVSLIDLTTTPFRTVETVSAGHSPEGLKLSPDGKFLAVGAIDGSTKPKNNPFYHDHGRLILFAVDGHHLRRLAEAPIGAWSQGIAFAKDGKTILVGSMVERALDVFRFEDGKLVPGARLPVGGGPAAIRTSWP